MLTPFRIVIDSTAPAFFIIGLHISRKVSRSTFPWLVSSTLFTNRRSSLGHKTQPVIVGLQKEDWLFRGTRCGSSKDCVKTYTALRISHALLASVTLSVDMTPCQLQEEQVDCSGQDH